MIERELAEFAAEASGFKLADAEAVWGAGAWKVYPHKVNVIAPSGAKSTYERPALDHDFAAGDLAAVIERIKMALRPPKDLTPATREDTNDLKIEIEALRTELATLRAGRVAQATPPASAPPAGKKG